ncbi:putative LIMR family protein [Blattamonas nauphoetae]|uniref:LIMR family protein n=1 Tax=Blattamonas nauphoetae TaxID=2049346 RepID=A0ABQ9XFR7_9EUKA|nr:putative LIMR family protein [Blattamonas nauphoetae]
MFLIFGFIGMFKLPFDCILACCFRPKRLSKNDYIEYKKKLTNKCNQVHDDIHLYKMVVSEKMVSKNPKERSLDRKQRKRLIDLQTQVDDIVNKYAQVEYVEKQDQYNVCIPILKLIAGIIFLIFAGLCLVRLHGSYLALSVIEGSISIGTKFLLITFYPMKPHNTLPNAMLFNGILYALSSYALLQFSADAFQGFAHNTSVNGLFVNQMKNMSGIKYIFRYLNYVVLGFIVLGLIYDRPIKAEMEDSPAVDGDINGPELEKLLQSDKATAIWMQDQCKAEQESMKTKGVNLLPLKVRNTSIIKEKPLVNRIEFNTSFDFTKVTQILVGQPIPCPTKPGFTYINVILFTDILGPMIFPYLYSDTVKNDLSRWLFVNNQLDRAEHVVDEFKPV